MVQSLPREDGHNSRTVASRPMCTERGGAFVRSMFQHLGQRLALDCGRDSGCGSRLLATYSPKNSLESQKKRCFIKNVLWSRNILSFLGGLRSIFDVGWWLYVGWFSAACLLCVWDPKQQTFNVTFGVHGYCISRKNRRPSAFCQKLNRTLLCF